MWSVLRGNGSVGGLHLVELEAAIDRLLDVGGALDSVAVGIEAQRAGNGIDGQTGQRVADGGAVGGLGLFDGRDCSHIRVIAERGDCRDNVVAAVVGEVLGIAVQPRLVAGDEFLGKAGLVVLVKERGDENLHVGAVLRIGDRGVFPGIAAEDGEADAESGSLLDDLRSVGDGGRRKDDVRAAGDGVIEVRGEVRRALDKRLIGYDLAACGFKGFYKVLGKADSVVVAEHRQNVSLLGAELFHGERGHDGALERIEEADAEIIIVAGGDGRVRAGAADGRDLGVCEVGAGGNGNAGAVGAEHDGNFVGNQLLRRRDGLVGRGLVVLNVKFDLDRKSVV